MRIRARRLGRIVLGWGVLAVLAVLAARSVEWRRVFEALRTATPPWLLLAVIANAMGIQEPANAIFIIALGVIFVLLLHFSVATTRLAEETKILAQENARLDLELREASGRADEPAHDRPVRPEDGS